MALNKYKIGNLVTISNEKNTKNRNLEFYGINKEKVFVPTFANTDGLDGSKYKIMTKGRFVFSGMQTGRDMCLRIGLYDYDFDTLISPAYTTFEVDTTKVVPEYFFMLFKSDEMDRYCAFLTDGSIRANLDWEIFCDIDIELPSIDIQQKYVNVYKAMVANQKAYEKGLDDLKLVCDAYIENLRKTIPCEEIGQYIEEINIKNSDEKVKYAIGVSVNGIFNSVRTANKESTKGCKIVNYNNLLWATQTTCGIGIGAVDVYKGDKTAICAPTCCIIKTNELLNVDYLLMWLKRNEFLRYAQFYGSGVVEKFGIELMNEVKIPIPDISIQNAIANIFVVYKKRKEINEKLKTQIKDLCPILVAGAINEAKKEV